MSGSGVAEAHRAAADVMRPSFARLHVAGWSAYALLSFLTLLAYGKGLEFWVVPAATALVGAAGTWAIRPFARRWRGLTLPRQLLATLPLALLVSFLMGLANRLANSVFCDPCGSQSPAPLEYLAAAVTPLYVVMSWLGLYFGITTWRALQAQRQQLLQANALAHEAQLKMLRYQLNPHFLFNTLNAISTLVLDRDTTTANVMVQRLSAFLRHSLDNDPMQRVSLRQELGALQLYLDIERTRFGDRLSLSTDIAPECFGALVPSLLLQPLVENAIKYAIAPRVTGGELTITARREGGHLLLQVLDDGPGWPGLGTSGALPEGNGVGLRNAFERLRVLYGERSRCGAYNREGGGLEVRLELPFESREDSR
jgi:signal transduction histidine kinase